MQFQNKHDKDDRWIFERNPDTGIIKKRRPGDYGNEQIVNPAVNAVPNIKTEIMDCYTREQIEATMASKGYKYFNGGNYDVNIIGVRNSKTKNRVTNAFDDCMTLSYKVEGEWKFHCYKCTTDPGTHWVKNLINPDGVAILKPGQYRSSHKIGLHQGKYEALRQAKPLKVYRDDNTDGVYDCLEEDVEKGIFGINIHRATGKPRGKSTRVDKWSAGCQVISSYEDFEEFLGICKQSSEIWGNSFSYTLLESKDIV